MLLYFLLKCLVINIFLLSTLRSLTCIFSAFSYPKWFHYFLKLYLIFSFAIIFIHFPNCAQLFMLVMCFLLLQYSLRQLDLSLLSQLWSLNESIQDFRQMLQEERVLSPPSPSPTPSSGDEEFYVSATSLNFRPGSVTTQTSVGMRRQSTSSNGSSMGG